MSPKTPLSRWSLVAPAVFLLATACAPSTAPAEPSAPAAAVPAVQPAPSLANLPLSSPRVENGRFVARAQYQGPCVDGRGGCYSIAFAPNGTLSQVLLDASITGRYTIEGDTVTTFESAKPGVDLGTGTPLRTKDGFWTLGEYRYQPTFTAPVAFRAEDGATVVCGPEGGMFVAAGIRTDGYCLVSLADGKVKLGYGGGVHHNWTVSPDGSQLLNEGPPFRRLPAVPADIASARKVVPLTGPGWETTPEGGVRLAGPATYREEGCTGAACAVLELQANGAAVWTPAAGAPPQRGSFAVDSQPGDPPRILGVSFAPTGATTLRGTTKDDLIHLDFEGKVLVHGAK